MVIIPRVAERGVLRVLAALGGCIGHQHALTWGTAHPAFEWQKHRVSYTW